ncbi:glycosyl hydrolase family 18 protein [Pelotomaculum propionicicum]|uniref:Putative sporulation-specific glycosylase YdhD n=1 Tax=Pelotomaculum propionicicum TaxID=258475 RepID=A0A4Y7RW25_9FIRM|nr:glycosyl hydrolase family 18 protein [Pelotomaculum propionicicum]NLI13873.1 glycoside hydrolase [Peptococcaceae bacterium]TEB13111.1 putative sporulation-specific glycosylase YdhD [Pelotomaculum propionicicum]
MEHARRALIAVLVFAGLLAGLFFYPAYASAASKKMTVLGYYAEDYPGDKLSFNSLSNKQALVNSVAFFSYLVNKDGDGDLTGSVPKDGVKLAADRNAKSLLLVHNVGEYNSRDVIHKVLSVEKNRRNLERNIVSLVKGNGFKGVNIDFEGVPARDRSNYNKFLSELSQMLKPGGYLLTVSIPAKTTDNPSNEWYGAYDYRTIGKTADLVAVMTYEEHWSGGSPGPIASLPWVQRVLDYTVRNIPKEKVLMGIPAYGYDWSAVGNKSVRWYKTGELISKYGPAKWNDWASSPYLIYYDDKGKKHEVWFENKYSLGIKLNLAKSYGIGGIAIWRLGFEDASFWETVRAELS